MSSALLVLLLPNLAFTAGILAVLLIRKPVRAEFGARMGYALWIIPVLAVVATFLPPRVIERTVQVFAAPEPAFEPISTGPAYMLPAAPVDAAVLPAAAIGAPIDPAAIALFIWLAGAVVMIAWLARRQAQFLTDVRAGYAGPAVVGVFRPRIVTPADFGTRFDAEEQRVILAHETIHLTRHDARINALVALVRCLCWYNPLVHIGAYCLRIDQELACDAGVVERHPKARRLYADALLKAQLAARPLPLGCYWPAGTEHPLMERIEMLKKSAPGRLRRTIGATLLLTLATAAGLAAWAAMPPTERTVYKEPEQSPAPAAQKMDYSWQNSLRIQGKIVAVNLAGSPPTVQVMGADANSGVSILPPPSNSPLALSLRDQPPQLWTIDLTPTGRAPTQDRDLDAAKIGTLVDVLAYHIDKACTSNCTVWGRNLQAVRAPTQGAFKKPDFGLPPRYDTMRAVLVDGVVSSVVKSGRDNVITVRSKTVTRLPGAGGKKQETRDWRIIQYTDATPQNRVFETNASVGMDISLQGIPETDADCTNTCTLALLSSNLWVNRDGKIVPPKGDLSKPLYDAATMAPPADRHNDAPSPIAQPGFNPEDYVVVRGTIVRVEGGNPVKTFWVRAREINRNYGKTQANTDTWRIDRDTGAPQTRGDFKVGAEIRVDGFVSATCQPECRIQPMLIDLVQQQAAAEPKPPATPGAQPIRFEPQQDNRANTRVNAVTVIGKVQRIELDNPTSYFWVQADQTVPNKPGRTALEKTDKLYRIAAGSKDRAPDWIKRSDAAGARVKVMGFEPDGVACETQTCELGAFDVFLVTGPAMTSWCTPAQWKPPGMWESCTPSKAPPGLPADFMPFAKYFDADKPLVLKGKPQSAGFFEGRPVLWMSSADIQLGGAKDFTTDKREWGVVMGPSSEMSIDAVLKTFANQDITVRGYGAKDPSCVPACLVNARDITLPSGEKIFIGKATPPAIVQPAAPTPPKPTPTSGETVIPFMKGGRLQDVDDPGPAARLPDLIRFEQYFDAKAPRQVTGKVTAIDSFEGHAALVVDMAFVRTPKDFITPAIGNKIAWRVVLGRLENAPAWARSPSLIGKVITVRGYNAKDKSCDPECLMSGYDVEIGVSGEVLSGWGEPKTAVQPAAKLQPIRYEPQAAARTDADDPIRIMLATKTGRVIWSVLPPPHAGDLAPRVDLDRDLRLKGKVTAVETSGDNLMLTISGRTLSTAYGAEEEEGRTWRVAVGQIGPSRSTLRDASKQMLGQDVSIRGLGLSGDACVPDCRMFARDVTVTSLTQISTPFTPL